MHLCVCVCVLLFVFAVPLCACLSVRHPWRAAPPLYLVIECWVLLVCHISCPHSDGISCDTSNVFVQRTVCMRTFRHSHIWCSLPSYHTQAWKPCWGVPGFCGCLSHRFFCLHYCIGMLTRALDRITQQAPVFCRNGTNERGQRRGLAFLGHAFDIK